MKAQNNIGKDSMTQEEKLFVEHALTFCRETAKVADEASDGKVFLAKIFESVLEGGVEKETKEMDRSCPDCETTMRKRGSKKTVLTTTGDIQRKRLYFKCLRCCRKEHLADHRTTDEMDKITS